MEVQRKVDRGKKHTPMRRCPCCGEERAARELELGGTWVRWEATDPPLDQVVDVHGDSLGRHDVWPYDKEHRVRVADLGVLQAREHTRAVFLRRSDPTGAKRPRNGDNDQPPRQGAAMSGRHFPGAALRTHLEDGDTEERLQRLEEVVVEHDHNFPLELRISSQFVTASAP